MKNIQLGIRIYMTKNCRGVISNDIWELIDYDVYIAITNIYTTLWIDLSGVYDEIERNAR